MTSAALSLRALVIAAGPVLLTACESANRARDGQYVRPAGLVLTSDPAVEAQLELVGPRIVRRADAEFLDLELHSKTHARQRIQVWVEWYDRAGRRVDTTLDGWTPLELDGGARRNLSIPVPVAGVGSWRLHAARIDGRL